METFFTGLKETKLHRVGLAKNGLISARRSKAKSHLPFVKISLVPNAHPLQVDPEISFLCAFEGFSLVSGCALPDHPFVGSRPVLSSRA
jgi:hypothetical protein